jgi:hypothetical protein
VAERGNTAVVWKRSSERLLLGAFLLDTAKSYGTEEALRCE